MGAYPTATATATRDTVTITIDREGAEYIADVMDREAQMGDRGARGIVEVIETAVAAADA